MIEIHSTIDTLRLTDILGSLKMERLESKKVIFNEQIIDLVELNRYS